MEEFKETALTLKASNTKREKPNAHLLSQESLKSSEREKRKSKRISLPADATKLEEENKS